MNECCEPYKCDKVYPSACVMLSSTQKYDCEEGNTCYKTLDDLLLYWKGKICTIDNSIDLSLLRRNCYTTNSNDGITVATVLQDLIDLSCSQADTITALSVQLLNYFPNYHLETLNFKCIGVDPCLIGQPPSVNTAFQRLIDKICDIATTTSTLQVLYNGLPYQYPIDFTKYSCISQDLGKSDLENLFVKVNEICSTYGGNLQIQNALAMDPLGATSIAQTLGNIWIKILTMSGGGGSGTSYNFDANYFTIGGGNSVTINCAALLANCVTPSYVRSQFTQGSGITISPTGQISATPVQLTADTNGATLPSGVLRVSQKRYMFYESTMGTPPSGDTGTTFVSSTIGTGIFTITPPSASTTPIYVYLHNAGTSITLIPGIDYTFAVGRTQLTLSTPLVANDILEITYL